MIESQEGRKLHGQAAQAREDAHYPESLDYNGRALLAYDADGDDAGFAEGIACYAITLRVVGNLHGSKNILTLAKYAMMGSVEIARKSGEKTALAMPLYNLANVQEDLGELPEAVATYKEAIVAMTENSPERHNRPEILTDMKVKLETCSYKAGDKTALDRALEALHKLEGYEFDQFEKDVWVSGGYMRLAEILKEDNSEDAKTYLQKAKEIIDANPKLINRKEQWEKLAQSFA